MRNNQKIHDKSAGKCLRFCVLAAHSFHQLLENYTHRMRAGLAR